MRTPARTIALLIAVSSFSTACKRIEPPLVELHGVRLSSIGLRGATLVADLRIENPNDFAIETDSITFALDASDPAEADSWTRVSSGTSRDPMRLDAGDRRAVEVPLELSYSDLSGPVRSVIDRGTFKYRVSGELRVREPRRTRVPFSKTGNLSMTGSQ